MMCLKFLSLRFLYVCMVNTIYLFSFVETPGKFLIISIILIFHVISESVDVVCSLSLV